MKISKRHTSLDRKPAMRMSSRQKREAAISMRISPETLAVIDSAAVAQGKTRTEFVVESARVHAIDVLLDQRLFTLNPDDYDAFLRVLDNPPPPAARLRELMAKKAPWER